MIERKQVSDNVTVVRFDHGPVSALDLEFLLALRAELAPGQVDADSLPPDDVLDAILEGYVEGDRSVTELEADGFDPATVRRVARLVDVSEYKRRQAPPGVRITPRGFGKDWRYPITSGFRPKS